MARRLFPPELLIDSNGDPVPGGLFRIFDDEFAGNQVPDLVSQDGVSTLAASGGWFVARTDGYTPWFRGPDTGSGANETAQLFIDTGVGIRTPLVATDALQETLAATSQILAYIAANPAGSGGSGGGLPVGTTLDDIANGLDRLAMTSAERTKLQTVATGATALTIGTTATTAKAGNYAPTAAGIGAVANVTGVSRVWGRTLAQGLPTTAEGALDGDWCWIDAS